MTFYERLTANRNKSAVGQEMRKILEQHNNVVIFGDTKVSLNDDIMRIEHSGKEHDDMSNVDYNIHQLGIASCIDELKHYLVELGEMGKPNYYYVIKFQV